MLTVDPFYAIEISRLAHDRKQNGLPVYHMEFGQPSTGAPQAALAVAHRVLDSDAMGYWESVPLKARLARHYLEAYNVNVGPSRIPITMGASSALTLAFSVLFQPGDRVALARPGYSPYRNTLKALKLVPQEIACGPDTGFQLTAAHIAALEPAPQGIIIASPANPTGTMLDKTELNAIVDVCTARGIQIISDEIYHGLCYTKQAHSILEFTDAAVVVNSFSKYYSMAGWRLGWLVVPEVWAKTFYNYIGNMFLTPPSLAQHAALAAMDAHGELQTHVETYRTNRDLLLQRLPTLGITKIAPPDGAFYIYADIGHLTNDSMAFCRKLVLETGVALAPGIDFDPQDGGRFVRFSFAAATPIIESAMQIFGAWI